MRLSLRVKQEDFDKLPILDRIEFRQKYDSIEDGKGYIQNTIYLLFYSIIYLSSIMVLDIWQSLHTGMLFSSEVYSNFLTIISLYIVLMFIIDVIKTIIKRKKLRQLEQQYFSLTTKKARIK